MDIMRNEMGIHREQLLSTSIEVCVNVMMKHEENSFLVVTRGNREKRKRHVHWMK